MERQNIQKFLRMFVFIILFFIPFVVFAGTANYPFPIDSDYANGIRITSYNPTTLQNLYNTWKNRYVVTASPGQRVISPEPINGVTNRTVSEGIGYGMLLAVYFADQTLFDNLWAFKVARSSGKTTQLMPWVIENDGITIVDPNSASDADFDIAFALLMAHYQWGSGGTYNYQSLALTEIQRCRQYDINTGTNSVRPGDAWNDWGYPSYYFPAFFRVFGQYEGGSYQTTWNNVVNRCLQNINTNRNTSSGLVGEICNVDTGARRYDNPCSGGCDGTLYKYNSCRVPWRYATDWLWHGNTTDSSGNEVNLLASFWNGRAPADVRDGYRINDNSVQGSVNNACFVGPAGCSLQYSNTYQSRLTDYYTRTLSFDVNESYYNGTLQILTLLLMTGNFHNLRSFGSPEPTRTYTPVPSGQTIDCFEDGNGINDWGGEWYTYADKGGSACGSIVATIWPAPNTGVTPSAGGPSGSLYYLRVTGTKGAATPTNNCYPSIGFGTDLRYKITQTAGVVDLRPFYSAGGGVRFYARGNGTTIYKMTLVPRGAGETIHTDWAMYEFQFVPPSSWTQIVIPFADFTQPTWSSETYPLNTVLQIMQKIQIQNGTNDAMTFDFSMDCLELYPYLWTPTPQMTPTRTRTPTPAGTSTFTRTRTPTASPTRTNTSAASPTFTRTRTATPTYTRTASPTFSRTPTGTNTTAATSTFTSTRTASPTYSRTRTPTEIITIVFTPTNTPSRTASPTSSRTPTPSNTYPPTSTYTRTSTPTQIITTVFTPTNTPSRTASTTSSRTVTVTNTSIPTNTFTLTRTPTSTFTVTDTVSSNTPTVTPTNTQTFTITLTSTPTYTRTGTPTFTYTNTPVDTSTFTRTFTLTATNTYTPTWTRTFTPNQFIIAGPWTGDQGWFDPSQMFYILHDHKKFYQINIKNIEAPFIQQHGIIYWLVIQMPILYPIEVGWKTTLNKYEDTAVWGFPGTWTPVINPIVGPLDFAFVITGGYPKPDLDCNGTLRWTKVKAGSTVTGSFEVGNIGQPGSLLDWEVSNWPTWGTWNFTPSSGNGLLAGSWVTVNVSVVAPTQTNTQFTGTIEVRNKNDYTDNCTIAASLMTPRSKISIDMLVINLLQRFFRQFPVLHWIINPKY